MGANKEKETALVFAAAMIMQEVVYNELLTDEDRGKMRKYALSLKDMAETEADNA